MKISFLVAALLGAASIVAAPLPGQPAPAPATPAAPEGPQASSLSLDEALTLALSANRVLAAARLGREEAVARQDVAGQRPNPEIALEESRDTPRHAATVSLPIEPGGKRHRRIPVATAQPTSHK